MRKLAHGSPSVGEVDQAGAEPFEEIVPHRTQGEIVLVHYFDGTPQKKKRRIDFEVGETWNARAPAPPRPEDYSRRASTSSFRTTAADDDIALRLPLERWTIPFDLSTNAVTAIGPFSETALPRNARRFVRTDTTGENVFLKSKIRHAATARLLSNTGPSKIADARCWCAPACGPEMRRALRCRLFVCCAACAAPPPILGRGRARWRKRLQGARSQASPGKLPPRAPPTMKKPEEPGHRIARYVRVKTRRKTIQCRLIVAIVQSRQLTRAWRWFCFAKLLPHHACAPRW